MLLSQCVLTGIMHVLETVQPAKDPSKCFLHNVSLSQQYSLLQMLGKAYLACAVLATLGLHLLSTGSALPCPALHCPCQVLTLSRPAA